MHEAKINTKISNLKNLQVSQSTSHRVSTSPFLYLITVIFLITTLLPSHLLHAQAENVPAYHRVYEFLHRMEVRKILPVYHGTVIPISRKEVAAYLAEIEEKRNRLSRTERQLLDLYMREFAYDLYGETIESVDLFRRGEWVQRFDNLVSHKQKYLYSWYDDGNSIFIDGIVAFERRTRTGDQPANLTMAEIGGRIRGTLGGRVGYYLDGINGKTWGDRSFGLEDQRLLTNSNYRLIGNDYYDESMGYIRFDTGWFGLQLGRERMLWRENYGSSLVLSSNPPMFDFIRFDASYGVVNYNFFHGWIIGPREMIVFDPELPPLPHNQQKYFVAHRVEFSLFKNSLQVGINETLIYARESPEIGYLNPVSFLISTERNLGDRDKLMLGLDFAVRPVRNFEFKFGVLFDDINFERSFTSHAQNRWAVHTGLYYVDPFGIRDLDFFVDYIRVEPYVYAHQRSPDRYYAHTDFLLGHPLGPNSDDTLVRLVYRPQWQWRIKLEFQRERHGDNIVDDEGNVIRNVGGDFLYPFRQGDDMRKVFLDGILSKNYYYRAEVMYEVFKQFIVGGRIEFAQLSRDNEMWNNTTFSFGIWIDY